MGVSQKIMRAHCAVIRPDHFKFASYGPDPNHNIQILIKLVGLFYTSPVLAFLL